MVDFFCRICTFVTIHVFYQPCNWIKNLIDLFFFEVNLFNARFQILLRGRPYIWGLKYKERVTPERRLMILANGPSLTDDILKIEVEKNDYTDYVMMNFSANDSIFFQYKPKYYCFADHMFFKEDYRLAKVKKLFSSIEKNVDWEMTIYVTYHAKVFQAFSGITNPFIKIQRVYPFELSGPNWLVNYLCKRGVAIPGIGTVANLAAYIGIQMGYKNIEFCGNDMSLLDGLCVNDNNETCTLDKHYYDTEIRIKPYIDPSSQKTIRLSKYIDMVNRMVKSHERIAEYGKYMGVQFVNRTRKSMLDCYPRLIKIHPEEFED